MRLHLVVPVLFLCLGLSACGLTESASTAATVAAAQAKQAEQAKQQEAQIRAQLDAANAQAEKRLKDADEASK